MVKQKFINELIKLSSEVYKHLGGGTYDEKDYQKALGHEFSQKNIEYLREIHIELFYKKIPLKLGAPDFYFNKIKPPAILEVKLGSGLEEINRQQLKMYLLSISKSTNPILRNVREGYLLNFLKVEPSTEIHHEKKNKKEYYKIEVEHYRLNDNKKFKLLNKPYKVGPFNITDQQSEISQTKL
ncbi:uncharacterized protein METZ01_LOCUS339434 [marine metagenome]|uniref:GxxExxY protein n=1 Tax=marine metagenome TaxID=408172 RepID=A0A382QNV8_9ZZZZ